MEEENLRISFENKVVLLEEENKRMQEEINSLKEALELKAKQERSLQVLHYNSSNRTE